MRRYVGAQVCIGTYRLTVEEAPNHSSTVTRFKDVGTRLYPRPLDVALSSNAFLDSFSLF